MVDGVVADLANRFRKFSLDHENSCCSNSFSYFRQRLLGGSQTLSDVRPTRIFCVLNKRDGRSAERAKSDRCGVLEILFVVVLVIRVFVPFFGCTQYKMGTIDL